MKKFVFPFLMIAILASCNSEDVGTSLSGMADNVKNAMFILGGPGGSRDTVQLDESNAFSYDFTELENAANYYIMSNKETFTLYIAPDMKLDVFFNQTNFLESLNFAGEGSDINNYLADKARAVNLRLDSADWVQDAESFIEWGLGILKKQQDLIAAQIKDNAEDAFWSREEGEILYTWVGWMGSYAMMYKYYSGGEKPELPEDFNSYRDNLDLNKPDYLDSRAFANYLTKAVREESNNKFTKLTEENPEVAVNKSLLNLETGVSMLTNEKVRNHFLLTTITGKMSWQALTELDEEIAFFKENCKDEESIAKFEEQYAAWEKLAQGAQAIEFKGEDLKGNVVNFSDFKGKYVYVDVWATWCGPCKYEIPFLKKLEADYHDRNIVFLSYSIDDDKEAWLNFVPEKELGGVQIIGEKGWKSALCLDYKVRGVPTFMFFDPEGKIIDVKMSRPSSQDTRDAFDSYDDL
ncbi:MAG: TlpA family protein disulfide reductase [Bacteroidetes bacterium]|nr:TlpA family protein disulfide reductase [Bacteroidota bacterium]MBT7093906.1 TlpA family protein disulfide reductase [Bacteroidota bacterium]